MISELIDIGGPWKVLPIGIYEATMNEVRDCFANNHHRQHLFSGFKEAVSSLKEAGCILVLLNGSFVTEKELPGDYDACWGTTGVSPSKLDPVFLDFENGRKKQKQKYFGEFFPKDLKANSIETFENFFQIEKQTGKLKGIIEINLKDEIFRGLT